MRDPWLNQVRSYVFGDRPFAKDLRTNVETADLSAMLDGQLDEFLLEAARQGLGRPRNPLIAAEAD